ncbi:PREDICTED: doublecortin domain-containing protein 2-like [Calidris pugnax]|uniref:doublecortin domain-containing protein 2-like n=1 Tax=Calidris pugnax TaxID=198806 RepID=UPI00071C4156|nr:PREDICTED: doublecortin domain-containing protein 2-like [Calidris pugnax]
MNGEESGETVKERSLVEGSKKKLNENDEDEAEETGNVDQAEEELIHLNGKKDEENGEGMEHLNYQGDLQPEEEIKEEDFDSQKQVDSHLEKTSTNPRVTITSPQESDKKNDQSNDYAAVA